MGSNRRRKRRRSLPEIILAIRRQREENSTCWIRSMRFSFDDSLSYPHPLSSAWKITPIASRGRKRIRVIIAYNGGRIARGGINVSCLSTRVNPSPLLINRTLVSTRLPLSLFPSLPLRFRIVEHQINHSFASKVETRQKLSPFPTFLSLNFNRPSSDRDIESARNFPISCFSARR